MQKSLLSLYGVNKEVEGSIVGLIVIYQALFTGQIISSGWVFGLVR